MTLDNMTSRETFEEIRNMVIILGTVCKNIFIANIKIKMTFHLLVGILI